MSNFLDDETFLARWLDGRLSQKEDDLFKNSKEFHSLNMIIDRMNSLQLPVYNRELQFQELIRKLNPQESKKTFSTWFYAAAASLSILFGVFTLFNKSVEISTDYGEQMEINLPDSSVVNLYANSKILYHKKNWNKDRVIKLEGEAYFKVKKGKSFKVITENGNISVLGTEFNIQSRSDYLQIRCTEGKVKTDIRNQINILYAGNAIQYYDNKLEKYSLNKQNQNANNEASYKNTPILYIIKTLEEQYPVKISYSELDTRKRFTGSYTLNNIKIALETIFVPMEISYTFNQKSNEIHLEDNK